MASSGKSGKHYVEGKIFILNVKVKKRSFSVSIVQSYVVIFRKWKGWKILVSLVQFYDF
jgi:hypothetical protein